LITGAYGGHTVDFREFAAQGMILAGRLQSIANGVLSFADDLPESLAFGDAAYDSFLNKVDKYIEQHGMNLPEEPQARAKHPDPPCLTHPVRQLDKNSIDLGALIWATGYRFDFSWINLPVLDATGAPIHDRGVAPLPGIYFLGLPWLSKMNSSFLSGVGDDAARLADIIEERCDRRPETGAVSQA
jgi:putative flavoprotein involved in K+ transport